MHHLLQYYVKKKNHLIIWHLEILRPPLSFHPSPLTGSSDVCRHRLVLDLFRLAVSPDSAIALFYDCGHVTQQLEFPHLFL